MKESTNIKFDWLKLNDYQFNILVLVKMFATDDRPNTYVGTLQDIRNWLNIGQSQKNNEKIKKAIEELKNNNIITYDLKGNTYTITTIVDNEIIDKYYTIQKQVCKEDINTIRNYVIDNNKRILANMLKVYIFALNNASVITYETLGTLLNITKNQVANAINNLKLCNFEDNTVFETKIERVVCADKTIKTIGSKLSVKYDFTENK